MKTKIASRSLRPSDRRRSPEQALPDCRAAVVRRAKRRIAAGFYDLDIVIDAVVDEILKGVSRPRRAGRQASKNGATKGIKVVGRRAKRFGRSE